MMYKESSFAQVMRAVSGKPALARFVLLLLAMALAALPGTALASSGPAHTETLQAGPYVVNVNLYSDPPMTDQSVKVTVVPQDSHLRLTGAIYTIPGLGTDAVELHSQLTPLDTSGTLVGSIRMPVRGAWTILVQLNGPQGAGQASFPITVAAPGAIPIWLGWLIGLLPMLGVSWLIWHQYRYRRRLLARSHGELST
ncbi:MAG TPA: hypothetical protein VKT25_06365 [Ktedonobacteraceae bacterium]|nr:hypothetical protein [Ktedonobacteraceae bacterium]